MQLDCLSRVLTTTKKTLICKIQQAIQLSYFSDTTLMYFTKFANVIFKACSVSKALRDLAFAQVLARLLSKSSQNTYSVVSGYIHTCLVSESVILQMLLAKIGSTKLESLNNEYRRFI